MFVKPITSIRPGAIKIKSTPSEDLRYDTEDMTACDREAESAGWKHESVIPSRPNVDN
jgi:hypothetical protein